MTTETFKYNNQKPNKFELIDMGGGLNLTDVLFGYEDIDSGNLYVVTDNDDLYITYELQFNIKKTTKKSIFHKSIESVINKAIWLGESNDEVIRNGKLANEGDIFLGAKGTKKRKIILSDLNELLTKVYHFDA